MQKGLTSIVMLAYDLDSFFADMSMTAFKSISDASGEKEFIVVDNGSVVGSGQWKGLPEVYIRNKTNQGYPKAVNQGVALATGEFIAIANNDIKVSPNWLEVALETFKDPKVGSVHYRMDGYSEERPLGNETWVGGKEKWCSSSFFVIRREAFLGYDESYGLGGYDDWDFWHRVRDIEGWKQAYTNKARYQHRDSSTQIALDDGISRAKRDSENREYFKQKYGEYADVLFAQKFPEQVSQSWRPFP